MIEFNPDGSIKMPSKIAEKKHKDSVRMSSQQAIKIKKEILPDKCCNLVITRSSALRQNINIENIYKHFDCITPMKFSQISGSEFVINIGRDFNRCRECTKLLNRFRDVVDGNLILERGACTYGDNLRTRSSFSYEDYFD